MTQQEQLELLVRNAAKRFQDAHPCTGKGIDVHHLFVRLNQYDVQTDRNLQRVVEYNTATNAFEARIASGLPEGGGYFVNEMNYALERVRAGY